MSLLLFMLLMPLAFKRLGVKWMLAIGMGLRMLVDREWAWSVHQSNVEQRGRKKADRNADWDTHVKRSAFLILLLGLVCDRPAVEVRDALLEHDILTGTSGDANVLRILAPLVLQPEHVDRLAQALESIATGPN